jgi:hypothetical protein
MTETNTLTVTEPVTEPAANMEQICRRYQRLYAGVVFDYLDHTGLPHQLLSSKITPLTLEMKIAGPAFTVKGSTSTERDESVRYKRLQMITQMTYPCVEVRDRGTPFSVALYGELSATSARAHGDARQRLPDRDGLPRLLPRAQPDRGVRAVDDG